MRPAVVPPSFFGWIPRVWTYPEESIIVESGLDTAVYLRLLSFGEGAGRGGGRTGNLAPQRINCMHGSLGGLMWQRVVHVL